MNDKIGSDTDSLLAARQMFALVPSEFVSSRIDTTRWAVISRPTFTLEQACRSLVTEEAIRLETETGKSVGVFVTKITRLDFDDPIYIGAPHTVALEADDLGERKVYIRAVRAIGSSELDQLGHITWQYHDEERSSRQLFETWR